MSFASLVKNEPVSTHGGLPVREKQWGIVHVFAYTVSVAHHKSVWIHAPRSLKTLDIASDSSSLGARTVEK